MGERWFVGAGTAHYSDRFREAYGEDDRPELAAEIDRMRDLFVGLEYQVAPGFGVDLDRDTFRTRLRDFVKRRGEHDTVVVYYTGHGVVDEGRLFLPMTGTTDDVAETSLPASYLTGGLLGGRTPAGQPLVAVRRVLFLLDTCHAGAVLDEAAADAQRFLARMQDPDTKPLMALVVAARPREQAGSRAFTQAFVDAVSHRATGGHEPEHLALDGIVNVVNRNTPDWQHARLFLTGDGATEFVPNPRYNQWLRGLDLRTQALQEIRNDRRVDVKDHVVPHAQGLDVSDPDRDDLWLFEGRHEALREACAWLRADQPPTLVVTGDPGSGKSALLSRLYVLADKTLRRRVIGLDLLPEDTIPALGSITRFVHARGMAAEDLMHALCEATGRAEPTTSPGTFLAELGECPPLVVVVDAVDEAIGKRNSSAGKYLSVVQEVLQPLIAGAARTRLRLLIGTRRHLLDPLGTPLADTPAHLARLLDLDDAAYADRPSIRRYIESCLLKLGPASPYIGQKRTYLDAVVDALADAAGNSFLVALITARSLALTPRAVDPYDAAWRAGLPRAAADAMRADLDHRLDEHADRARDLLLPLAYAHGTGLPWEDIWPRLVRRLTGRDCSNADLDWLIDEAGYYITESTAQGGLRSVYRLYHESLGEHLRGTRPDPAADEAAVTAELIDQVPRRIDGHPDWDRAHPYTRENLATHAAVGGVLDDLVTDPRFLLAAEPPHLLAALPATTTLDGARAADAYRRADARLRTAHQAHRAADRPAYLQLAARCGRAPALAEAVTDATMPLSWATPWASWRLQSSRHTFTGHSGWVSSVALGQVEGRTVIISGSADATVRVWDAATGRQVGDAFTGHTDWVNAVAIGQVEGRTVIISGSADATVRVWDAATGRQVGDAFTGHTDWVNAVAIGQVEGRTVIISGSDDATVRVWDAATGRQVGDAFTGHTDPVNAVAIGQVEGRTVIISGSADRTVRVWDAATGRQVGDAFTGHTDPVNAVAIGQVEGRTVIISGSDDATVRVWDAATGRQVGDAFTGHTDPVNAVAIGQVEGRTVIISGSDDATVRVWDAATGRQVGDAFTGHTDPVNAVAIGQVEGRTVIISGSDDATVRVWDAATGRQVGDAFTGHTDPVNAVAIGQVEGRTVIISGSDDATVRVWDAATGRQVGDAFTGHTGWVRSVAIGQVEGRTVIISGSADATVRVWDAATGRQVGDAFTGHTGWVSSVAIGQVEGRTVIISGSGDRTVRVWDAATGRQVGDAFTGHTGWVNAVAIGQVEGRTVIISGSADATVRVWDAATGRQVGDAFTGHTDWVNAVAIGQVEGRTVIISGSDDATVRVWDAATGRQVGDAFTGHTDWVNAVAIGQVEGRTVIISGSGDRTVRVWDAATGRQVGDAFTGHTGPVSSVAIGQVEGRTVIISGSGDRTVRVWDAATGRQVGDAFTGHTDWVNAVAIGQVEGRTVIISGSADATVRVWDAATGRQVGDAFTGHTGWVNAVAIGQVEGRTVIISGSGDRTVRVWDAATGRQVGDAFTGHTGPVSSVAIGQVEGRTVIISGSADATVRVWDAATGRQVGDAFTGHTDWVNAVAIGQVEGRTVIISGSADATVRVWDAATGRQVGDAFTGHTDWVNAVAIGQVEGRTVIISGSDDATVRVWDAATGRQVGDAFTGHTDPVNAVAIGQVEGRTVIISGSADATVRVWDAATGQPWSALHQVDVASPIAAIALEKLPDDWSLRIAVGAELGVVVLRVPHSSLLLGSQLSTG